MDNTKERLVKMIQDSVGGCARHWAEIIADNLIANDVAPLVRCKDCRFYHKEKGGWCELHDFEFDVNGYCCDGERRENV